MCWVYAVTKVHTLLTYIQGPETWIRKRMSFSSLLAVISQLLSLQILEQCLCDSVGKLCQPVSWVVQHGLWLTLFKFNFLLGKRSCLFSVATVVAIKMNRYYKNEQITYCIDTDFCLASASCIHDYWQLKQPDVCVREQFFNHVGFCTINSLVLIASLSPKGPAFSLHFAISKSANSFW